MRPVSLPNITESGDYSEIPVYQIADEGSEMSLFLNVSVVAFCIRTLYFGRISAQSI